MKLLLATSKDSALPQVLPGLKKALEDEIINVEVEELQAAQMLDIPKAIQGRDDFDLVFVFVVYRRQKVEVKVLLEKLVALEMEGGPRIVKAVLKLDEDWDTEELVAKWKKKLLKELFGSEAEGTEAAERKEAEDEAEAEEEADYEENKRGGFRLF